MVNKEATRLRHKMEYEKLLDRSKAITQFTMVRPQTQDEFVLEFDRDRPYMDYFSAYEKLFYGTNRNHPNENYFEN